MQIGNRRSVITGAASGIGWALLEQLASQPGQIIAVDRANIDLSVLKRSVANIHTFKADLSQPQEIDTVFAFAQEVMGGLNTFFANAGFAYYETVKPDWQRVRDLYEVNVFSPLYTLAKMAQINHQQPYAVIITASAMAHTALPGYAHYAATKAALHRFAEAYRYEMPENGHLMLVYPIATRTRFFASAANSAPVVYPIQTPDYVAGRIIAGLQKGKKRVYPSTLYRAMYTLPLMERLYQIYANWQFRQWIKHQKA